MLAALDDLGLTENTIVVLWGDHGWHLGDAQIWKKHTPFERAVHSPLIIRTPKVHSAGCQYDALVETLDIYPTLVDLCSLRNARTEYPLDGTSLAPLLNSSEDEIREAALSYWGAAVSIRTKTHRLIAKHVKDVPSNLELYDIRESQDPLHNCAAEQPERVQHLLEYASSR